MYDIVIGMKRRLFISLNLPEDIKETISRELEKIRYGFTDDVRFMDPEQWHITLLFLGPQEDEAIGRILKAMKTTAGNFDEPVIEFSDISYGPKKGAPRMIWLNGSVKSSKSLQDLKDDLENSLVDNGVVFGREHRQFAIHITLARFLSSENLSELNIKFNQEFSVSTLDLMESHASKNGAKYEFLQKMDFRVE